ncbi:MAG: HigA family addiction module antidote protein [Candidatus Accumulibacter sp.]|uniref:HigA family addiction module antidote protein n=1 Tax=Candidatus Accumulibacter affinis TaxID=2954384 RepID=A0A935T7P4_9PROT|nr:HigA family addiction module antidote protein [Candidatus Accumulibacter affinis]
MDREDSSGSRPGSSPTFQHQVSRILHGHAAVTADMDLRLHEALGTSAGYWLRLQAQRDLWTAGVRAKEPAPVARIAA